MESPQQIEEVPRPPSPLPEALRRDTQDLHVQAEGSTFMRALLHGQVGLTGYVAMLRNLHVIYAALEPALGRHALDPRLAPLALPGLAREPALRRDLEALCGEGWQEAAAPLPAAQRYVARLRSLDATQPELLAAHSYVRYLGDLSGGQALARIVRDNLRFSADGGVAFYDFGGAAETARLRKAYRAALAALAPDAAELHAIVAEARLSFELHCQLFDELADAHLMPAAARPEPVQDRPLNALTRP